MTTNNAYNSNKASDLIGQGWAMELQRADLDKADNEQASASLNGIKQVMSDHHDQDAAIKSDPELNGNGKNSRRAALINRSDEKINALTGRRIADLKEREANQINSVANSVKVTPTQADTLEMIHRRELAAEIDPLLRYVELEKMARDGSDDLTLHACLTASKLKPLVTPAQASDLRDIMAARIAPDQADELQKTQSHLALIQSAKNQAHRQLATDSERRTLGVNPVQDVV